MFENQQVLLTAIDPTRMDCFEHFQEFLSNDKYTARKLQPCSATEFSVLHVIDAGIEGIVLKCNQPQGKVPVALKLVCRKEFMRWRSNCSSSFKAIHLRMPPYGH